MTIGPTLHHRKQTWPRGATGSLGLIYIPISKMAEDGNATYASFSTSSGYLGEPSEPSADEVVLMEESREREASATPTILNRLKSPTASDLAAMQSPETWQTLSST